MPLKVVEATREEILAELGVFERRYGVHTSQLEDAFMRRNVLGRRVLVETTDFVRWDQLRTMLAMAASDERPNRRAARQARSSTSATTHR